MAKLPTPVERYTFHKDVEIPRNLQLISSVYLDKQVVKGFNALGCGSIFTSPDTPYLYGFHISSDKCIRCDSKYHS